MQTIIPSWGLAMTEHYDVTFTVKELLQEIKGKVENIDSHVRDLELRGTARENALAKQVAELNDRFNTLERSMATRSAVEQAIVMQEKQARSIRFNSFGLAASIMLVVVEFLALMWKH